MRTNNGIVWINGVAWLIQNGQATNAIGLPGECPQRFKNFYSCPHNFNVQIKSTPQLEADLARIEADSVGKLLLPQVTPFEMQMFKYVVSAEPRVEARIVNRLTHMWNDGMTARTRMLKQFSLRPTMTKAKETNLLPLVFVDASYREQPKLDALFELRLEHYTIIVGDDSCVVPSWNADRVPASKLTWDDLEKMDLPSIGSLHLRKLMRGQQ